jgi:PadR family transcriptional regulator PadR
VRRELGNFEQQVLLTILRLSGEAYSVPMVTEMKERSGREVSQAAVHITLCRLEEKGLVTSWMENADSTGTGRDRRWFKVEASGMELLRNARRTMDRFWEGLDAVLERAHERPRPGADAAAPTEADLGR